MFERLRVPPHDRHKSAVLRLFFMPRPVEMGIQTLYAQNITHPALLGNLLGHSRCWCKRCDLSAPCTHQRSFRVIFSAVIFRTHTSWPSIFTRAPSFPIDIGRPWGSRGRWKAPRNFILTLPKSELKSTPRRKRSPSSSGLSAPQAGFRGVSPLWPPRCRSLLPQVTANSCNGAGIQNDQSGCPHAGQFD